MFLSSRVQFSMDVEDSLSFPHRQLDTTGDERELNEVLLSHTAYNQFADEDFVGNCAFT